MVYHSEFRQEYYPFLSLLLNLHLIDLQDLFLSLLLMISLFDAIEDITVDHLRTLQHVIPSITRLHVFNRTILHRLEVLLPSLNDRVTTLGLLNDVSFVGWVLGVCGITVKILQFFNSVLSLWFGFLSFVVDPDVFVEVILTEILNALLSTFLPRVHDCLELINQSPDTPISRNDGILGISQHKDQFGSVLVVAGNFEVLQQEIDGGIGQFLGENVAILEIGDELGEEIVPVRVYVQGFHVEVDDVDDMLLLLVVHSLPLLLVVLKDDGL